MEADVIYIDSEEEEEEEGPSPSPSPLNQQEEGPQQQQQWEAELEEPMESPTEGWQSPAQDQPRRLGPGELQSQMDKAIQELKRRLTEAAFHGSRHGQLRPNS